MVDMMVLRVLELDTSGLEKSGSASAAQALNRSLGAAAAKSAGNDSGVQRVVIGSGQGSYQERRSAEPEVLKSFDDDDY